MSVAPVPGAIAELAQGTSVTRAALESRGRPVVLRGLVDAWPAVRRARDSQAALIDYLRRFDCGAAVDALMTAPEHGGRLFYDETLSGFNFLRNRLPLAQVIEQVQRYGRFAASPAVAAQSAPTRECLPGFSEENALPLLDAQVPARIWLGNRITTPTHVDEWNNIGCVVAGGRRFTLFPPEQVVNLYVGPLDFAPTGAPMSLVRLHAPDFERYPRFRAAIAAAQVAELAPGDALYVPPLWWHHVESLDGFNVLVNYWWHSQAGDPASADSAFDALLQAMLAIRELPASARQGWRAFFDRYVFEEQSAVTAHIPEPRRGILARLSKEQRARLRAQLAKRLSR